MDQYQSMNVSYSIPFLWIPLKYYLNSHSHFPQFLLFPINTINKVLPPSTHEYILILLRDKHIYTHIYAYFEIYENVKVTPIRQLAMVI